MDIVRATFTWTPPPIDVLTLYAEPMPEQWVADLDDRGQFFIYRVIDADEQETGDVAGVEILGFSTFGEWEDLPRLPLLWQLPGNAPVPLIELLQQLQRELPTRRSGAAPSSAPGSSGEAHRGRACCREARHSASGERRQGA